MARCEADFSKSDRTAVPAAEGFVSTLFRRFLGCRASRAAFRLAILFRDTDVSGEVTAGCVQRWFEAAFVPKTTRPARSFRLSRMVWSAGLVVAVTLAFSATAFAQSSSTGAEPVNAAAFARAALQGGRPDVALSVADAMLRQAPGSSEAHLIRALALRDAGMLSAADDAAVAAWRAASSRDERFAAAFIAGDIAARQERWSSSQIWLRRADQNARDAAARDTVARAYRGVSQRNPLKVQLSFTLRPSDNLNSGSDPESESQYFPGLRADAKIGGYELGAGATLSYRLSEDRTHLTEAFGSLYARRAILESGFEDIIPGTDRNEFDYATLSVGLSHRFSAFEGLGPTGLRGSVGASYYRNGHLSNFAELGVTQDFSLSERALLRVGATLRDETRFDTPIASYVSKGASLDYFSATEGGLRYSVGTALTFFDSDAATVEGRQLQVRGRVDLGRSLWGARPDLGLSFTYREFPDYNFLFAPIIGRSDRTVSASLGLTYEDFSWYGFLPRLEMTLSEVNSSDDIWDRSSFGIGATLVSRF